MLCTCSIKCLCYNNCVFYSSSFDILSIGTPYNYSPTYPPYFQPYPIGNTCSLVHTARQELLSYFLDLYGPQVMLSNKPRGGGGANKMRIPNQYSPPGRINKIIKTKIKFIDCGGQVMTCSASLPSFQLSSEGTVLIHPLITMVTSRHLSISLDMVTSPALSS